MRPPVFKYYAVSTKTGRGVGFMTCFKSDISQRPDYDGKTFVIRGMATYPKGQGTGTAIVNFAKTLSKKWGCNGYISCQANTGENPNAVSHLFFRKMGFTTLNKKTDKKIDKFIKRGKVARYTDFQCDLMFSPQPKTKPSFFEKLKNSILPHKPL